MFTESLIMKNDINTISLSLKERFLDFKIPFYHISHADVEKFESSSPYVLWVLGNEEHKSFDYKFNDKNCLAIVKPYPFIRNYNPVNQPYMLDPATQRIFVAVDREDPRVLNIPLGHSRNFTKKYSEKRDVKIGFYGQISGIRSAILTSVPGLESFVYEKFGITRSGEEYCNFLSRSLLSFCPTGQSPETYRLYESALSGCGIIGNPLPFTDYYRECPMISIPWQEFNHANLDKIGEIIEYMISNHASISSESIKWAQKWSNPDHIQSMIVGHIKKFCT